MIEAQMPADPTIAAIWNEYGQATTQESDEYQAAVDRAYAELDATKAAADVAWRQAIDAAKVRCNVATSEAWRAYWRRTDQARRDRLAATDEHVYGDLGRSGPPLPAPVGPPLDAAGRVVPGPRAQAAANDWAGRIGLPQPYPAVPAGAAPGAAVDPMPAAPADPPRARPFVSPPVPSDAAYAARSGTLPPPAP